MVMRVGFVADRCRVDMEPSPEVFGHAVLVRQSLPVEWCGQSLSGTPYQEDLVAGLNFAIQRRVHNPPSKYQAPFPSKSMTLVVLEFKGMN